MKRPNITPAPWRIKSTNKSASLEILGGDKFNHIALCDGKRKESHFQAQQANARAIAALPELLAAMEGVIPFADVDLEPDEKTVEVPIESLKEIKAALTKAGYTFD